MDKKFIFGAVLGIFSFASLSSPLCALAGEKTKAKPGRTVVQTDRRMPRHAEYLVDVTGSHIPQRITPYGFSGAFLPVDAVPFNETTRSRDTSVAAVLDRLPYITNRGGR